MPGIAKSPKFNFSSFVLSSSALRIKTIRQAFFKFWRVPWDNYFKVQHTTGIPAISVKLPEDELVLFTPQAITAYVSHISFGSAYIRWARSQFGNPASEDIANFFNTLTPYYLKASAIFRQVPTTCGRKGRGGIAVALTRLVDKDLNAAPSLHVVIVLHIYLWLDKTIRRHAVPGDDFETVRKAFFDHAVSIIDSTLLTKQHCLLDIALALVLVRMEDPDFTEELVNKVIDSMFQHNIYRMPQKSINAVREKIRQIYSEQFRAAQAAGTEGYPSVLINYLRGLNK